MGRHRLGVDGGVGRRDVDGNSFFVHFDADGGGKVKKNDGAPKKRSNKTVFKRAVDARRRRPTGMLSASYFYVPNRRRRRIFLFPKRTRRSFFFVYRP